MKRQQTLVQSINANRDTFLHNEYLNRAAIAQRVTL